MLRDRSSLMLIGANVINVILAMIYRWSIYDVMLVYWFQSISIGIFTCYKLLSYPLEKYQEEIDEGNALEVNDLAVTNPQAAKLILAVFFTCHYGIFHFGYIMFISGFARSEGYHLDLFWSSIGALFFLVNHLYSYRVHKQNDLREKEGKNLPILNKSNIMDIFNKPYARIIPIHLTIMAGAALSFLLSNGSFANRLVLLIFMGIKTFMDVWAHSRKHEAADLGD